MALRGTPCGSSLRGSTFGNSFKRSVYRPLECAGGIVLPSASFLPSKHSPEQFISFLGSRPKVGNVIPYDGLARDHRCGSLAARTGIRACHISYASFTRRVD